MPLFKYFGPAASAASLSKPGEYTLRFNHPKDYNDPYELFLLPDEPLESIEERAYYENFLKQLPQAPVTCFSRRPDSTVMWAHYGQLSTGICLELDEDKLFQEIDGGYICDVEYSDSPAYISSNAIKLACTTKKNRHTLFLLSSANRAAYFRKRAIWSYEQERRLVLTHDQVIELNKLLLGRYSSVSIARIIIGPHADHGLREMVMSYAKESGVEVMDMAYSRRVVHPIFRLLDKTYYWTGDWFQHQEHCCNKCFEPLENDNRKCHWCELSEEDLAWARNTNQTMAFVGAGVMPGIPLLFDGLVRRGRRIST